MLMKNLCRSSAFLIGTDRKSLVEDDGSDVIIVP